MWRQIISLAAGVACFSLVSHVVPRTEAQNRATGTRVTVLPKKPAVKPTVPALVKPPAQPVTLATTNPAAPLDPDQQALKLFKPVEEIAKSWLRRPELQQSQVGLEIMDIPSGRVLFSHNARKRFVSASTAKVFTNACVYDLFGGDYTYKTALLGFGDVRGAKLNGPLVVLPSQDPSFSTNTLNSMVSTLASKVNSIAGNVYVGQTPGGGDFFATEWLVQDWGQDWMPPSSDFVVDRNVALSKDLGRGYPLTTVGSDAEPIALTRSLLKGPWASAWVHFNKYNNAVVFHRPDGPLQNEPVVANPTEYNAAIVRASLKSHGIKYSGKEMPTTGSAIVLAQDVSPPLSEIVKFCLEHSDNLYAQQLLRTIGTMPALNTKLENASLEDRGLARMSNWLSTRCGVSPNEVILFDGCGLSRKDAVTPHALNMVLRHMGGAAGNGPFLELLKRDADGLSKSFRYKTGAMDSVRSITGIVRTSTGQPIAVTALINDHTPSVRELRASLFSLVNRIEALGSIKLKPVTPPRPKVSAVRVKSRPTARRARRRH